MEFFLFYFAEVFFSKCVLDILDMTLIYALMSHHIFVTSLSHYVLVLGGIRTQNILMFGQTPQPSCLGAWQEDSCLSKVSN